MAVPPLSRLIGAAAGTVGPFFVLPVALVVLPAFNVLLFAIENFLFLLFPTRMMPTNPGDFQFMARMYLMFLMKAGAYLLCAGVAAVPAALAYWLSGGSWAITLLSLWLVVVLEAAVTIPCVAWAFRRFDPSTDTPA